MILIIATETDTAMSEVVRALEARGRRDVLWLDLEQAFDQVILRSKVDAGAVTWSIQSRQHPELVVTPENLTAVYWRRTVSHVGSPLLGIPSSKNLDQVEIFWSIRWHLESLPAHLFPLGHPWVFARAENKHRQMEAALRVGFTVAPTFHSNDPSLLSEFVTEQGEVAVKALRMPAVSATGEVHRARHITCRSFKAEELTPHLAKVERTQLYCQRAIHRRQDWRITVLPHQSICTAIDTSNLPGNKLDWREDSYDLPHHIVTLDPAFEKQLRQFLAEMELTSGYFDFAVPDEGPPVFFECNTNAQWFWIEKVTGYPFADAIAAELASNARS